MAIFKCKMCGGTIEFEQGASVGICDSCGTKQTLPRLDDDKKSALYERANHFRRNNEFDKAMGIYEQILNEDNTDAEAYWSLVLCKYGIDYVEDPSTHKRIPTVNRAQYTAVFNDENYKAALQYADGYQREIYEEEAKAINEIQKGILSISQQEEPFDVFICYKETDASGRRTPDSVLANDLYYGLTQEGFKVFFARITLEDKLGSAYEPYIFAALNSAKVMVVLGTKPEYFNAVWVKNEWSRYLALVKQSGGKKMLIPAYKDMDPYDLPEEFAHLQSQDMGKLGFMQDLIRGIKKIATPEETKTVVKEVSQGSGIDKDALLKRASLFLLDGNWKSADEYCDKVLDTDPENAQAYLYKLMAELHVKKESDIAGCVGTLTKNNNYNKIMLFGSEELKAKLHEYDNACKYNYAVSVLHDHNYESAKKLFEELHGYKDSENRITECIQGIEQIKIEQEKQRIEAEQAAKKAEERRKLQEREKFKKLSVTKLILTCVILFLLFLPFLMVELNMETDGFGMAVFVISIVLLIPCFIAYVVVAIQTIAIKKRGACNTAADIKFAKINTTVLTLFVIALYLLTFVYKMHVYWNSYGEYIGMYARFATAFIVIHIAAYQWKLLFQSKAMIAAIISIISLGIFGTVTMNRILVSAVITIVALTIQLIFVKKRKLHIDKKHIVQFIVSVSAAVACIAFCAISLSVMKNRETAIRECLSEKTMLLTYYDGPKPEDEDNEVYKSGYKFSKNGERHTSLNSSSQEYHYTITIDFDWWGFGDAYFTYDRGRLIFDENNNVTGMECYSDYSGHKVYELIDSIPNVSSNDIQ